MSTEALAIALGYLLGSIPFGLVLTRAAGLGDVRKIGSGSIGATNVLRTGNKGLAAATVLLDGGKGAAAVLLAGLFAGQTGALLAGLAAVVGHMFPVWLGFKGGKSVATGVGVMFAAAWPVALGLCAVWLIMAVMFRISSLASLTGCAAAPVLALLLADQRVALLALVMAALIFWAHRGNIARLLAGTEPRIGAGK
jgi:glycerol-3-phosphate acyltransferase PlsY